MFTQLRSPSVPPALRGPVLLDDRHCPRYWPAVWTVMGGNDLAASTLTKRLRQIESLYAHADETDHRCWRRPKFDPPVNIGSAPTGYKPGDALTALQTRQLAFASAQAWGADQIFCQIRRELNPSEPA